MRDPILVHGFDRRILSQLCMSEGSVAEKCPAGGIGSGIGGVYGSSSANEKAIDEVLYEK